MPRTTKRHDRKPKYGGGARPRKQRRNKPGSGDPTAVRLQKVLAGAGVGSRRQCEEMITEGRVEVDGETVTELGTRVDPTRQQIRADGELLRRPKRLYFLVNKPLGIVCTSNDPAGRTRVIDLVPTHERLFTIGRLDKSSEGLILATNDGELTDLLTHPRYGVEKTYLAQVAGVPSAEALEKLRHGVRLSEGYAHAKRVFVRKKHGQSAILEIVLDEGRNREVRRLLARAGHKVMKLRRIAIGPLRLADLSPGEHRAMRRDEVEELYAVARAGRQPEKKPRGAKPAKPGSGKTGSSKSDAAAAPLIDESLPMSPAGDGDDQTWLLPEADLAAFEPSNDFDGLEGAVEGDEDDREELAVRARRSRIEGAPVATAKIDLSPIVKGQDKRAPRGKVIGGGIGHKKIARLNKKSPRGKRAGGPKRKP